MKALSIITTNCLLAPGNPKTMKIPRFGWLLILIFALSSGYSFAEDQPAAPSPPHSASHITKLEAALDQPGIPVTINQRLGERLPGKRTQLLRGLYPVTKDYTLYVNGLSVKSNAPSGLTAKGLEIKIAYTIKGGSAKYVFVESRYVDADDIPKLQEFLKAMATDAQSKTHDENDHSDSKYVTSGLSTFGFARNGNKDSGYYVFNEPNITYAFWLKSGNDVAKLQSAVNDAATWVNAH